MATIAAPRWNPFRHQALGPVVEVLDAPPLPINSKSKTWETTIDRIASWPEEARPLKHHDWVTYLFILGDVVLVVLPIYFIRELASSRRHTVELTLQVLGVAVVTLNGKPVEGNTFATKVTSAIQLVCGN